MFVLSGRIQSDHVISAIRSLESKTAAAETENGHWTKPLRGSSAAPTSLIIF